MASRMSLLSSEGPARQQVLLVCVSQEGRWQRWQQTLKGATVKGVLSKQEQRLRVSWCTDAEGGQAGVEGWAECQPKGRDT